MRKLLSLCFFLSLLSFLQFGQFGQKILFFRMQLLDILLQLLGSDGEFIQLPDQFVHFSIHIKIKDREYLV